MKSCFCFGNHDAPDRIMELIESSVDLHIVDDGVTEFIVGNHGNFDRMAAQAVMEAKKDHPEIKLTFLMPYYPMRVPDGFDGAIYPERQERVPKRYAIAKANRYMIDQVEYLMVYVRNTAGNARKLFDYAQRRQKQGKLTIEDIYDAETELQRPRDLIREKTVLLTSKEHGVIPAMKTVQLQMERLIDDGFTVFIADTTSPYGQLALEHLLAIRKSKEEYLICVCNGVAPIYRVNAVPKYEKSENYIDLVIQADCSYYYSNYEAVLRDAGFVCTEQGCVPV